MISDNQKKYMDQESANGPDNYKPLPVVLSEAKGVWVWDVDQNKYLDMMSAYSAVSHGHAHPELVKVFQQQSQTLALLLFLQDCLKILCRFQYKILVNP